MGQRQKTKNDNSLRNLHGRYPDNIPREKFNGGKWRHDSVRNLLRDISSRKCAFCEQEIHGTRYKGEVEHFRPVAKYWWLAYTWENLVYVCSICNNKKSATFPLGNRKATAWGDLSQESPLLINPLDEDPQRFITYENSTTGDPGKIIPKNARVKKRVDTMTETCGLNRSVLKGKRRLILMVLDSVIASHEEWGGSHTETLRELSNPENAEFTGMVKTYLGEKNIVL
ncbi:MAG: retron system putative HNH endonuclease [Candidatus Thorarchaeota archaeon]